MKYILEGTSKEDKSIFIEKIKKDNPKIEFKIMHMSEFSKTTFIEFISLALSDEDIIFDGFYLKSIIYQTELERQKIGGLSNEEYIILDKAISNFVKAGDLVCVYLDNPKLSNFFKLKYDILINLSKVPWEIVEII